MKTKSITLWVSLASSVLLAAACSSSSSDAPPPSGGNDASTPVNDASTGTPDANTGSSTTVADACNAVADAVCAKLESCGAVFVGALYGDATACKARNVLGCITGSGATGQQATPDQLMACGAAIPSLDCKDVVGVDFGPKCTIPGTLKDGAPCGYSGECESAFCAIGDGASCGTCAPKTKDGDPCVNGVCSGGLSCTDSVCYALGDAAIGESCARQSDCIVKGGACNPITHRCVALTIASGTCGLQGDGYATCQAAAKCSAPAGNGTCAASAKDGEACSDTASCVPPARCIGGTCTLPSPTCK